MSVVPAGRQDLEAVVALLADCGLPTEDVHQHLDDFVLEREGEAVRAVAGLEVHGDCALLRSVAVADARVLGVRQVFLLTTNAEEYFAKLGFHPVRRDAVPGEIRATREFGKLCPQSAAVLVRELQPAD